MNTKTHHFRIGLFVVTAAALFVIALFAMGLRSSLAKPDIFETCVPGNVENLAVGALVKLRGVTIGKVTALGFAGSEYPEYHQQAVLIHFAVPKDSVWSGDPAAIQSMLDNETARGLRVRVQTQGFLGAGILALDYVDPKFYPLEPLLWKPKHYYIPSAPNQLTRVLASLEQSLHKVDELDLDGVVQRAKQLMEDADKLALHLNKVDFEQIEKEANSLVSEIRESNRGLQRTLTDAQDAIKGADLPTVGKNAAALETKLSAAATEVRRLITSVDTGELAGSLANIRGATDELMVLLHTLEQRPSAVLFSKSPAPLPQLEKPPKQ